MLSARAQELEILREENQSLWLASGVGASGVASSSKDLPNVSARLEACFEEGIKDTLSRMVAAGVIDSK